MVTRTSNMLISCQGIFAIDIADMYPSAKVFRAPLFQVEGNDC